MRCERTRVRMYVWARDPGGERAFSEQGSYSSADGSGDIRVCFGKPLRQRQCRDDHINYPLFGRSSVTQASVHRWEMAFGVMISNYGQVTE